MRQAAAPTEGKNIRKTSKYRVSLTVQFPRPLCHTALIGVLKELSDFSLEFNEEGINKPEKLRQAGRKYGAPDFKKRNFFRSVVDGRHKLVRWFSPEEYGNPSTLDELLATSDVALYDLVNDPGELENLAHPDHPGSDPAQIERMLAKLHALVEHEIGTTAVHLT
jgi:hypothetical protein